ncbi:MAG: hypothetical protein KDI68_07970 [Gammaproteobacteria bacterium]|nr:hypothetical protein [Gammaproteobacteria bacterium]
MHPNLASSLASLLLLTALSADAAQLFRQPATTQPLPTELAMDCSQLEREIARLQPLTYSYKPAFHQNPYQGVALTAGTLLSQFYYLYHGYDYYLDYREQARIMPAQEKIARLQQLKAEQRCFL